MKILKKNEEFGKTGILEEIDEKIRCVWVKNEKDLNRSSYKYSEICKFG